MMCLRIETAAARLHPWRAIRTWPYYKPHRHAADVVERVARDERDRWLVRVIDEPNTPYPYSASFQGLAVSALRAHSTNMKTARGLGYDHAVAFPHGHRGHPPISFILMLRIDGRPRSLATLIVGRLFSPRTGMETPELT